ncbi:acyltransferase [Veronia nyctiphanis]|nr:acyltransferase family protein [Veronia nyctiphanis]
MKNTINEDRVFYLDLLRTAAILGVIAIHVTGYFVTNYQTYEGITWWVANVINSSSRFSIPMFLMLSGALLLNGKVAENPLALVKRRVLKLGIPFMIWSLIYFVYKHQVVGDTELSIVSFVENLIVEFATNGIYSHLWFMYVILAVYLVSPFIHRAVYGASEKEIRYLLVIWFVVSILLFSIQQVYAHFNDGFRYPLVIIDIPLAARYAGYFILGFYLYRFDIKQAWRDLAIALGAASLLTTPIVTYALTIDAGRLVESFYSPFAVTNCLAAVAIFLLCKQRSWESLPDKLRTLITAMSAATFGIYFIHMMIQDFVMRYVDLGQSITMISFMLVNTFLILVLSFVMVKVFNLHQKTARYLGA